MIDLSVVSGTRYETLWQNRRSKVLKVLKSFSKLKIVVIVPVVFFSNRTLVLWSFPTVSSPAAAVRCAGEEEQKNFKKLFTAIGKSNVLVGPERYLLYSKQYSKELGIIHRAGFI
jgi:hypothetical protein